MTPARIKTLRFLALLVMIAGGLAVPLVAYYGFGSLLNGGFRYADSFDAQRAIRRGTIVLMGELALCQVAIGLGGYARYRLKKMLIATPPAG
ncbi:hypothetical protein BH11MYX2_BH11MYX2_32140 [soil metagenome]